MNSNFVYVGSTKNINSRQSQHKNNLTLTEEHKAYNFKVYKTIRENGGWDNCVFEVIETVECETKLDVKKREQHFIVELNANLNSIKAFQPLSKKEIDKIYNDTHTDEIKAYREKNKERIKVNYHEYRIKNQEIRLEYARTYRSNNPDRIKEWNQIQAQKEPTLCSCGKYYTYKHKSRHLDSIYHKTSETKTINISTVSIANATTK